MISLYNYSNKKYEAYMMAFWDELKKYILSHGGNESRNKYRLYLPYTGPTPNVTADDTASAGSESYWTTLREAIKNIVALVLDDRGQWIRYNGFVEYTKPRFCIG